MEKFAKIKWIVLKETQIQIQLMVNDPKINKAWGFRGGLIYIQNDVAT